MAESPGPQEWSKNISMICKTSLDLPPSCLEFVPKPPEGAEASLHLRGFYHEYFVVGTYYLEKEESSETPLALENDDHTIEKSVVSKPQSKNGSLILFRFKERKLQIAETVLCPSAVFDLHFLPSSPVFAIVSSAGTVSILRIVERQETIDSEDSGSLKIKSLATHQVFSDDISPTFFTWAPNSQHTMGITTSNGVFLVNFSTDYRSFQILNSGQPVIEHSEYAWCCTFSSSGDRLYSGGDDNKLRLENLGSTLSDLDPDDYIEPSELYPKGLPGHEAGVTFILPIPIPSSDEQPQLLLTGSYDDNIRVYSIPSYPYRPKVLAESRLGGGVWRLKILGHAPASAANKSEIMVSYTVLASCMHAGAKILSVTGTREDSVSTEWSWEIKVLAEQRLHKSMNYASDVQAVEGLGGGTEAGSRICVSSSFYDRLLCIWEWDAEA